MERALYERLGALAPKAITIAKAHQVSVPQLLGAIAGVVAGLELDGGGYRPPHDAAAAAVELLRGHPELGAESWPECLDAATALDQRERQRATADNERQVERQRLTAEHKAAKGSAAERKRRAVELAEAER